MLTTLLLVGFLPFIAPAQSSVSFERTEQFRIPLQFEGTSGGYWGLENRKADHATVAINSENDVLVAYHSSRSDYNSTNYWTLKQVEIALLKYSSSAETWIYEAGNQKVVGGVDPSPLDQIYDQDDVKCERPDVIAVGEWFFVVWTRIYEREYGGTFNTPTSQINEPAVLECAWVKKDSNGVMQVYASAIAGQGKILDKDDSSTTRFFVRECAGCPDAVVLHPGDSNTPPTVGVVYPHQADFGDYDSANGNPANGDNTRLFELRFLTCSIDPSNYAITSVKYPPLVASTSSTTGIVYDGTNGAAGIILPDVAPGSVNWRFGLAYEEQLKPSSVTNGRILLQTWDVTPSGPNLTLLESHAFGNSGTTYYRRRPMLSAYPSAFPGQDVFAIAFNRRNASNVDEVIYQEWDMTDGAVPLTWEASWGWDGGTATTDDHKPVPLLGREISSNIYFGRCYAERSSLSKLLKYVRVDTAAEDTTSEIVEADKLQRPAAAYHYYGGNDNVALTWEQETTWDSNTAVQVWLRIE